MGVDVCHTNHADADSDDSDDLMTLLGVAGCTYFMGCPAVMMTSCWSTSPPVITTSPPCNACSAGARPRSSTIG